MHGNPTQTWVAITCNHHASTAAVWGGANHGCSGAQGEGWRSPLLLHRQYCYLPGHFSNQRLCMPREVPTSALSQQLCSLDWNLQRTAICLQAGTENVTICVLELSNAGNAYTGLITVSKATGRVRTKVACNTAGTMAAQL